MTQTITRLLTFEQFLALEDGGELTEYELLEGRVLPMPEPDDWHEEILEFLSFMFERTFRRLGKEVR